MQVLFKNYMVVIVTSHCTYAKFLCLNSCYEEIHFWHNCRVKQTNRKKVKHLQDWFLIMRFLYYRFENRRLKNNILSISFDAL